MVRNVYNTFAVFISCSFITVFVKYYVTVCLHDSTNEVVLFYLFTVNQPHSFSLSLESETGIFFFT